MMTLSFRKALFSVGYAHAVAAAAGVNVGQWQIDDDSVDLTLRRKGGCAPTLDLQLKCTADPVPAGNELPFSLSMKNYDDLRRPVQGARWLVVMHVPTETADWLTDESPDRVIVRKSAWWMALDGLPAVESQDSVTVRLPRANVFHPGAIVAKMDDLEALFHASFIPV